MLFRNTYFHKLKPCKKKTFFVQAAYFCSSFLDGNNAFAQTTPGSKDALAISFFFLARFGVKYLQVDDPPNCNLIRK
jgi:hypothetical protein